MPIKHVILRAPGKGALRGIPEAGAAMAAPAEPAKVEVGEINLRSVADLAKKKGIKAVAPVMPMKLIAPVSAESAAPAAAAAVAWGVRAVRADTSPFTGDGVVAAVLDTGIDPTHAAFAGIEIIRRNFTTEGDDDEHGHGTHCAGTIFGRAVNGTRIGVAPGIKKVLIGKVLGKGGGGSDRIVEAINWAVANGAHVVSMSLGIDFPGFVKELEKDGYPTELATSIALEGYRANVLLFERLASLVAASNAFMQATVLVAAAGNESRRQVNPDFEIAVSPPAVSAGIVSVAALGEQPGGLTVAPFSNVGARISGPGVTVVSAKRGGGLTEMSGTSMATPHVAGVAALWAQKLMIAGSLNGELLISKLIGSATTTALATGFDAVDVGAGMAQAPQD